MKFKQSFVIAMLLIFSFQLNRAQNNSEKETFEDAEYFFAQESYPDALASYLRLYKRGFKDNSNINYKIGICYLNTTTEKNKAVEHLQIAVKKVSDKYNEGNIKEINAPYDAYLFLGNAYRINLQLDKAIEAYGKYISLTLNEKGRDEDKNWAKMQIEACKRAKTGTNRPQRVKLTSLGKPLNTNTANYNPIISSDESTIIFITQQRFYNAIMFSKKKKDKWDAPINITPQIMSDGDQTPVYLSSDGKTLLLNRQDPYNSDIYISHFDGKVWSASTPLNKEVNTKYWESFASMSPDGKTLYFTSNKPLGYGGGDIYVAKLGYDGQWEPANNIGKDINTPYNEESPYIAPDGKTLYFSSQGHESIGGFDVYYSVKDENGKWSKPVNLGFPINTTDDDQNYVPTANKYFAYQARIVQGGLGDLDIVSIETFSEAHPYLFSIEGNLTDLIKNATPKKFSVKLIDNEQQILDSVTFNNGGDFAFQKPAGTYKLLFESSDFSITSNSFTVVENYPTDTYPLNSNVLGVTDSYNNFEAQKNKSDTTAGTKIAQANGENAPKKQTLIHNILFSFDNVNLTKDAQEEISSISAIMKSSPGLVIEVVGYTDAQGTDSYNKKLSESRAQIVKNKLVNSGINANRIKTSGKGEEDPIAINENLNGSDNPEGRAFNRRVEFKIIQSENPLIVVDSIRVPNKLKPKKL